MDEGESLDEIKAKLKPKKKAGVSADMLDAQIRMMIKLRC